MSTSNLNHVQLCLEDEAKRYGCPSLIELEGPLAPIHLNYLDLMVKKEKYTVFPQAVAEVQGRAVLYLLDGSRFVGLTPDRIKSLGQLLANRSEHAVLALVKPGELEIYPINISMKNIEKSRPLTIFASDPTAPFLFQSIASGTLALEGSPKETDYIFKEIHDLLTHASRALIKSMDPLDILSVTGRALFYRFLCDRKIITRKELDEICPAAAEQDLLSVFSCPESAAATSCWLDDTFNGNLLPLVEASGIELDAKSRYKAYYQFYSDMGNKTHGEIFMHLEAILKGWKHIGAGAFQPMLEGFVDWDEFNFAHIPIGVLSQVYETFSRQWDEFNARVTSVHYTPKHIAEILVEEALAGSDEAEKAVVLDPSCGAGIFLVLAFRCLVRKKWEQTGERPNTKGIHRILYDQLRGFDVCESALRLAALSLYITAIELNATTRPAKLLKAPFPLKDKVLFNVSDAEINADPSGFVLGSLARRAVPNSRNGKVDVVIGNPPWTRVRSNNALNTEFTKLTRRILNDRGLPELADRYKNPDGDPDLPFLWGATEWVRPGGMIAMVLPARIILKQGPPGKMAREALFRGLTINGIINGSDLEKTKVWPNIDVPWMLMWAQNNPAPKQHSFHFVTPLREEGLCRQGYFRIDYQSAQRVSVEAALEKPWLLKSLSIGTWLDVDVLDKVSEKAFPSLREFWRRPFVSGKGFSVATKKDGDVQEWLSQMPIFEASTARSGTIINDNRTFQEVYGRKAVHQTCGKGLYQAPLLIIPKAPGETKGNPKAYRILSGERCFTQTYYGYSGSGSPKGYFAITLLFLIVHSQYFKHFCLMRSSSIGAAHRIFTKEDIDALPFPPLESFNDGEQSKLIDLASRLEAGEAVLSDVNKVVYQIYGLDSSDIQVVEDTVKFGSPYRTVRVPASMVPSSADVSAFCEGIKRILIPFFGIDKKQIFVRDLGNTNGNHIWRFIHISLSNENGASISSMLPIAIQDANRTGASRVIVHLPNGNGLLLGVLNQKKFLTKSRARLCGSYIVRNHLHEFPIGSNGLSAGSVKS